jgi:hypothetical protein
MSRRPHPFGVPRPASQGASSGPGGISPSGTPSPHDVAGASRPPDAACSHSASDGSRHDPPAISPSQSQYAAASPHVTPTTGCDPREKRASPHHGGSGARPAARNLAYCSRVVGVRPSRKEAMPRVSEAGTRTQGGGEKGSDREFFGSCSAPVSSRRECGESILHRGGSDRFLVAEGTKLPVNPSVHLMGAPKGGARYASRNSIRTGTHQGGSR